VVKAQHCLLKAHFLQFANMLGITFDDALVKFIGQLGRGQQRIVALSSAFYIPNAFAFLLLVFAAVSPTSKHHWRCIDPQDAGCAAVHDAPELSQVAFCSLTKGAMAVHQQR